MQFAYADSLITRDNILRSAAGAEQVGLYIWGKSKYNADPSRNAAVSGNLITCSETGIALNGVADAVIGPNRIVTAADKRPITVTRGENVVVKQPRSATDAANTKP